MGSEPSTGRQQPACLPAFVQTHDPPFGGLAPAHHSRPGLPLEQGRLALLLAALTIVLGILTLDDQEGAALPSALVGFVAAYAAVLGTQLCAVGVLQARGYGPAAELAVAAGAKVADAPTS